MASTAQRSSLLRRIDLLVLVFDQAILRVPHCRRPSHRQRVSLNFLGALSLPIGGDVLRKVKLRVEEDVAADLIRRHFGSNRREAC